MEQSAVTVCITSFNRFDLLKQTIDSFNKLNTYFIKRIIIIEDSVNLEMKNKISQEYGTKIDLIFNDQNIGQALSIDKMYQTVDTEYIFHSEDDYIYSGNANFIKDSIDILEERKDVHQIWIRHINDYAINNININSVLEQEELLTVNNIKYRMIKSPHGGGWCGFSWNPGLRRTDDYNKMFPNGYGEFIIPEYKHSGVHIESFCNNNAMKRGYRAALLINGACNNLGTRNSTYK